MRKWEKVLKVWPLKFHIYVDASWGGVDYSTIPGAEPVDGVGWSVPVFAYELTKSRRDFTDGHLTLIDTFLIYAPPGRFSDNQEVGESPALGWIIQGHAEDNNNNPYWSPGLVTWIATRRTSLS